MPPLRPAPLQGPPTAGCPHAGAKSMHSFPRPLLGLICSLHAAQYTTGLGHPATSARHEDRLHSLRGHPVDKAPCCAHSPAREWLVCIPHGCSPRGVRDLSTGALRLPTGCSASVDNRRMPFVARGYALQAAAGTGHFQGESRALPRESIHSAAAYVTARGSS